MHRSPSFSVCGIWRHLRTSGRKGAGTTVERMEAAKMGVCAIAGLPCSAGLNAIRIRGKAHARGLCAREVVPVPVSTRKACAAACKGPLLRTHAVSSGLHHNTA